RIVYIIPISSALFILPRIGVATSESDVDALATEQKRGGARAFNFFAPPDEKRGGARAFNFFAPDEKRGGARAFNFFAPDEKRGGTRAFNFFVSDALPSSYEKRSGIQTFRDDYDEKQAGELKRAGGRLFRMVDLPDGDDFVPEGKKRGGARPFYGGGYMDGTWKRAGGRYFMRHFDDSPFAGWMAKRGGARAFFGDADGPFNSASYWAPRFVLPINKHPRRSLLMGPLENVEDEAEQQRMDSSPSPFFTNNHNFDGRANGRKRGGARAFNGAEETLLNVANLAKRGGGRNFNEMEDTEEYKKKRFGERIVSANPASCAMNFQPTQ
uniref:FMRFamide n=1 Tax=Globodera pallida TaxID=36090 RepID=A0A183C980_GLOPA